MELRRALENTKRIYMTDSALNSLLDFERVLDELDLFSFENWLDGELVSGPTVEKYWLTCRFMWPRAKMPDPSGAARLIPYGCKITYEKDKIKIPVKIDGPEAMDPTTKKARLVEVPVWIVEIRMPQELVSDIEEGSLEIASEEYDLADIQTAYKQDIDDQALTGANGEDAGDEFLGDEGDENVA